MQCPYYIHKALRRVLQPARRAHSRGADGNRRRVRRQGGISVDPRRPRGAAGVEVRPAGEADLRPAEDMAATTKRHPSRTRHRTAIDADGRLLAMDIEFVIDGGAYCTLSPVVLSRGTIHAAGPYYCPNVRVRSRGGGDQRAAARRVSRLRSAAEYLRARAAHGPRRGGRRPSRRTSSGGATSSPAGQSTAVGQIMQEPVDMPRLLDRAFELSDYHAKRAALRAREPARSCQARHRLRLLSCTARALPDPASSTSRRSSASRPRPTAACACWRPAPRSVRARTRSSRRSPATRSASTCEDVEIAQPDTAAVPDSGPTVASRTCMVVGKLVESARSA